MLAASDAIDWLTHMNWVDFVFLLIVVYSVVTGYWLGFLGEAVTLAGVAAGTLVAGLIYPSVGDLAGTLGVAKESRNWVGFVAVYLALAISFRICSLLARNISKVMVRGWSNGAAGALVGVLVGMMNVLFIIVTVAYFHLGHVDDPVHHSKIALASTDWLKEYVGLLPKEMQVIPGLLDK